MAATATDTVPLGVLDVLAAHRVPLTVAGALAMLEALRGSVTLLALYARYFPAEYKASVARRFVLGPEVYSPAELEFFSLVDERLFPLAYWFIEGVGVEQKRGLYDGELITWGGDIEEREPMVPLWPCGYDYEEPTYHRPAERFLAALCGYRDDVPDEELERDFDEEVLGALGIEPLGHDVFRHFNYLLARFEALPAASPVRDLPLFIQAIEHFTGNPWWDAAPDLSVGPAIQAYWGYEDLEWLRDEWAGAQAIRGRLDALFHWIESGPEHQVEAIRVFSEAVAEVASAAALAEEGGQDDDDDD